MKDLFRVLPFCDGAADSRNPLKFVDFLPLMDDPEYRIRMCLAGSLPLLVQRLTTTQYVHMPYGYLCRSVRVSYVLFCI